MKYLLILLALTSCGFKVSGDVTVHHKIEIATDWFNQYCADLYPNDTVAQAKCVDDLMAEFIKTLEKK